MTRQSYKCSPNCYATITNHFFYISKQFDLTYILYMIPVSQKKPMINYSLYLQHPHEEGAPKSETKCCNEICPYHDKRTFTLTIPEHLGNSTYQV